MAARWEKKRFSVDARLFEELGRRLVGSPAMALGELAKNAYDADAFHVEVALRPGGADEIVVRDSGHGMDRKDFLAFWMRVGTGHKAREKTSPYLGRPLTGSKGIGRVAAELLSHEIFLTTISSKHPSVALEARLNWDEALKEKDLVKVTARVRTRPAEPTETVGTTIRLIGLKSDWKTDDVKELAREIWRLEPPFRRRADFTEPPAPEEIPPLPKLRQVRSRKSRKGSRKTPEGAKYRRPEDFAIFFTADDDIAIAEFNNIRRVLETIYNAQITGEINDGVPRIAVSFKDQEPRVRTFREPQFVGKGAAKIQHAVFRIRVYDLQGKQPEGLKVGEIREHLRDYGGVQIYDNGFRLAYYGSRENDWLRITEDHARRLSESDILPDELHVSLGMHYMPTYWQVLGTVEISTTREDPNLEISITRDRLKPSPAFDMLAKAVRASLHWYGMIRMENEGPVPGARAANIKTAMEDVRGVLREYKDKIDKDVWSVLDSASKQAVKESKKREQEVVREVAYLGGLATAGIATISYHREVERQISRVEGLIEKHQSLPPELKTELKSWAEDARALRKVFSHLTHGENLEPAGGLAGRSLVEDAVDKLEFALRGVEVHNRVPRGLKLPSASYVEWSSVIQLLLTAAAEEAKATTEPYVSIAGTRSGKREGLIIAASALPKIPESGVIEGFDESRENLVSAPRAGMAIVKAICNYRGWDLSVVKLADKETEALRVTWKDENVAEDD